MKRSLDSTNVGPIEKDLYNGLFNAHDTLPSSLAGLNVACAGPLIYAEDAKYTFHLGPTVFAEIVEARGGLFAGNVTAKTDFVVIGMLEKEWTQKQNVSFPPSADPAAQRTPCSDSRPTPTNQASVKARVVTDTDESMAGHVD